MTRRMDRSRPLWEYWFCEGLADGRWALLSKIHHCMVDGVSGTDLYRLVLDPTPEPRRGPRRLAARGPASSARLRREAVWQLVSSPVDAGRALARSLAAPRRAAHTLARSAEAPWP